MTEQQRTMACTKARQNRAAATAGSLTYRTVLAEQSAFSNREGF